MARKSQRLSAGATTALPSHKRNASNTSLPGGEAKKTRTQKATPTKSQYFSKGEQNDAHSGSQDDDDASAPEDDGDDDPASAAEEDLSEFGSAPESDDAEDDEDDEEEYESEVEQPKSRRKSASAKIMAASSKKKSGGELWREGVKTGLGPGQEVIIKKPKARPAGKVPYSDETIHPNTILFLKDLKENNNREWLKMHDPDFRQSEKDWFSFVEKLTERLVEIDDTVPELPVKDIIFRIYRDVRFSKDPTPYKPHFSAAWSRTGRKGPYAHYYVQISSKDSFVGGGLWHPEAAPTAALRQAIDKRSRQMKNVLSDEKIRKEFLKGAPANDSKVVKAFVAANAANALKTRPKAFSSATEVDVCVRRVSRSEITVGDVESTPNKASTLMSNDVGPRVMVHGSAHAGARNAQLSELAVRLHPPARVHHDGDGPQRWLPAAVLGKTANRRPTRPQGRMRARHHLHQSTTAAGCQQLGESGSSTNAPDRHLREAQAKLDFTSQSTIAAENSETPLCLRNLDFPRNRKVWYWDGRSQLKRLGFRRLPAHGAIPLPASGYDADHPDIELLRLRNFTIGRSLTEDELLGPGGLERVSELLGSLKPFITYLNSVVMPDEAEPDSDDEDDDEEDEDDDDEGEDGNSSGAEDEPES
ncbi:hypothetical protein Q7P35_012176 [Cladosporium inversicolor]